MQQEEKYSSYDGAAAFRAFAFNFFPSCCWDSEYNIPPLKKNAPPFTFNSFPVAAQRQRIWFTCSPKPATFNSFPVAAHLHVARAGVRVHGLSILSRLQPGAGGLEGVEPAGAFNSFPVAAETLAAYSLISLSSANFEVPESSLALPSYTCSGSREAFPDSRRKEGQWRERNDA